MANKEVFVYHPTIESDIGASFEDTIHLLGSSSDKTSVPINDRLSLLLWYEYIDGRYAITVQLLTDKDLPFVAKKIDGNNETEIDIGEGNALSYKNVFVFDPYNNKLFEVRINGCPRANRLKYCLSKIYKEKKASSIKIRLNAVMDKGLISILRNAKTITSATISSLDYYGDDIPEGKLSAYKDYLSGRDYTKTVKLKAKNGANIFNIVSSIINDVVDNDGVDPMFKVSMKIDGNNVDFNKFYKKITVDINNDVRNSKYLDYSDLKNKLIKTAREYVDEK